MSTQNKTKTYVLLALVLGIWGVIGYKILSSLNPETPEIPNSNFNVSFTPNKTTTLDTFSIQATNRDPFLGTLYTTKKTPAKSTIKTELIWPPIQYHGHVTQQSGKNKVFIVSIVKVQHLMKIEQTIDNIKLIKGNKNEITVRFKGVIKTIAKI